jgi:hypothetical protein
VNQTISAFLLAFVLLTGSAFADEGMWLFESLPVQQLQSQYGFTPTQEWSDHVMKASVRFNSGGSGSFISGTGLVLTNHHVAADTLAKISTADHDYYATGYYAKSNAEEIAAPDLELNQLLSVEDVTAKVNAAVTPGMSEEQAAAARRSVIAGIESASTQATGLRSNVIPLYNGGQFHLYRYKRYTDVRLVFAPEFQMAFFGGDAANFEYPRFDLDMAIFRVYENGQPAKVDNFFAWSKANAKTNDLVFVSGNPGTTNRILTVAALESLRDKVLTFRRDLGFRREILLQQYSNRGAEQARRAHTALFGVQNSRKVFLGQLASLQDPAVMQIKKKAEADLRSAVAARPELQVYAGAWDRIAQAEATYRQLYVPYQMLETGQGFNSQLFKLARTLTRLAAEKQKPNGERLPEYQDQALPQLEQALFSPAPIYEDLEQTQLADSLAMMIDVFGAEDPLVKGVLDGKSPQVRAFELIARTQLKDVRIRHVVADAGQAGIDQSDDPMIKLAQLVDAKAREIRKALETKVTEPKTQLYSQIANAAFAVYGTGTYPDATFTLRLSYGEIKGFEQDGVSVDPVTTIAGAFQAEADHQARGDWALPQSWHNAMSQLDGTTPLNFASTADIIGGNSGSPVVNRDGELVGLIFDGNRFSFEGAFLYRSEFNRSVSVHSAGMLEALRKVYGAGALADEIGKAAPRSGMMEWIRKYLP